MVVFTIKEFSNSYYYKKKAATFSGLTAKNTKFLEFKISNYTLTGDTKEAIIKCNHLSEIAEIPQLEGDVDLPTFKSEK